jgi:hypothetical protein
MGLAAVANAQSSSTTDFTPVNVSVKAGIALPLDNNLANYGATLIALGLEYQFDRPLIAGTDTYISLDYLNKGFTFSHGVIPITLNERFYIDNGRRHQRTYAFLGIGGADVDTGTSSTVVCARAGLGADLGDAIFFEVAGLVTDKGNDATGNSVAFYVGYRF